MTILVTGAAGFIGSHMVDYLLKKGYTVLGIDNFSNGVRSNLDHALKSNRFTLLPLDLTENDKVKELFNKYKDIEVIYHLAARGSVPASIADPTLTFRHNVRATHDLMITAIERDVKTFVYASSSSVYGDIDCGPLKPIAKSEDMVTRPINPYGISKKITEMYGQNFHDLYKFNSAGLRFFNVYGPRQKAGTEYSAVIPNFINSALKGEDLYINGDGLQTRDFTFVYDVCEVMGRFLGIEPSSWSGKAYNVCTSKETTIDKLAKEICELTGSTSKVLSRNTRRGDIKNSVGSNAKLMHDLFWTPTTRLRHGLVETINYYKKVGL